MNSINCTHIEYLKKSRTIETVEVKSKLGRRIIYIYNHEGVQYSCFDSIQDLVLFFNGELQAELTFQDEMELDNYLETLELNIQITKEVLIPKLVKR